MTQAAADDSFHASLEVRVRQLDVFATQFRDQQDAIVHALVQLNRVNEFETVNSPMTDRMELAYYEIIAIASPAPSARPVTAPVFN